MKRLPGALSLVACCALLLPLVAVACRGGAADDPNAPLGVTVSQTYLTIANRSGSAIADGQIELVPAGVLAPYRMQMPRIESGATRDVQLDQFSGVGGSRFRRGVARMRAIRITATDMTGKTYKQEVPFK
ncbi:MAG TPA: hypothetical protein VIR54_04625 [Vicinamibacterales bacterium]|jgi:hypothetical protein